MDCRQQAKWCAGAAYNLTHSVRMQHLCHPTPEITMNINRYAFRRGIHWWATLAERAAQKYEKYGIRCTSVALGVIQSIRYVRRQPYKRQLIGAPDRGQSHIQQTGNRVTVDAFLRKKHLSRNTRALSIFISAAGGESIHATAPATVGKPARFVSGLLHPIQATLGRGPTLLDNKNWFCVYTNCVRNIVFLLEPSENVFGLETTNFQRKPISPAPKLRRDRPECAPSCCNPSTFATTSPSLR